MVVADMPLVSIVTPVYNCDKYLAECIESVLAQTYNNWEYLIVNNCSNDATLEIAKSYENKDNRIRVHTNDKHVDIITNHNIAFKLISSKSKYCKVVSADDWIYPECIMKMVELWEDNPNIGIVASYYLKGVEVVNTGLPYDKKVLSGKEVCRMRLLGGPYLFGAPSSLMYRSDIIKERGDFYDDPTPSGDTSVCYEVLKNHDYGIIHQVLAYARVHENSISTYQMRRLNTYLASHLDNLVKYGPIYLNEQELKEKTDEWLVNYYKFLGKSVFHYRDDEFWSFHKNKLKESGYPFNKMKLIKGVCNYLLKRFNIV